MQCRWAFNSQFHVCCQASQLWWHQIFYPPCPYKLLMSGHKIWFPLWLFLVNDYHNCAIICWRNTCSLVLQRHVLPLSHCSFDSLSLLCQCRVRMARKLFQGCNTTFLSISGKPTHVKVFPGAVGRSHIWPWNQHILLHTVGRMSSNNWKGTWHYCSFSTRSVSVLDKEQILYSV